MKTIVRPLGAALLLGAAALCAQVQAQDFRIGFVSIERLLRDSAPAKQGQSKLEAEFSKREKELLDTGNALKDASDRFEREAPTLSESQRSARQRQLIEQDRDFQRKRREFQEDLNQRKNEELQQVIDKANRVIRQVAETEKYDAILQEAAYINPQHDITDKVIKALNAAPGK